MYRVNYKTKIYNAVDAMSTSYQLGNVAVLPMEGLAVATDGKILAVCQVETTGKISEGPALVPGAAFAAVKNDGGSIDVHRDGYFALGKKQLHLGEGRYPNAAEVLNSAADDAYHGDSVQVTLDAKLLLRLAEAITPNGESPIITLEIPRGDASVCVSGECGVGVIMPCTLAADAPRGALRHYANLLANMPVSYGRPTKKEQVDAI